MDDTTYFKKTLAEEKVKLEGELEQLGKRDATNPENWDVAAPKLDIMSADENELADRTEELHIDSIVLDELEARYRLVLHAERKLEAGTYGTCEVCRQPIAEERLRANPAARTCKEHMGNESSLTL